MSEPNSNGYIGTVYPKHMDNEALVAHHEASTLYRTRRMSEEDWVDEYRARGQDVY